MRIIIWILRIGHRKQIANPDTIEMFCFCGENGVLVILYFDYAYALKPNMPVHRRFSWFVGDIDILFALILISWVCARLWGCISDSDE